MNTMLPYLWLIPGLPLLAAGITALAPRRARTFSALLAIGALAASCVLAVTAFVQTLDNPAGRLTFNFDWFVLGDTAVRLGWILDPLSASMLVMITFVGTLIFVFSVGYMEHDENFTRFFCFLSLFAAAMLGLVIANSLLLLFMCWELVGLASYLLIGFWYHKPSAAAAAKKAFITTRIGDVFFFLGLVWLSGEAGTLLFYDNGAGCLEQSALTKLAVQSTWIGMGTSTAIALLIFCGAMGKSGQVPLHVWLPDAMEGPTPVSALIHAATMGAAGVFLVARVFPLMETAPTGTAHTSRFAPQTPALVQSAERPAPAAEPASAPVAKGEAITQANHGSPSPAHPRISTALQVVTWVGAITALFAALVAVAQTDIKRILAYSTVSQLGFMFIGLGTGGVAVGMFHLLTHAFFKALLFLGSGSVIHGSHEEQDIRRMGSLRKWMPVTFVTYAVGMMALSGVPLLFCGFWSKDEILHAAWLWQPSKWPFVLAAVGAFLTAFYMTRQMWFVFFAPRVASSEPHSLTPSLPHPAGESDGRPEDVEGRSADVPGVGHEHAPHESPPVMLVPLGVLAVCTIVLSAFATPFFPWFHSYLSGHVPHAQGNIALGTLLMMLVSTALVVAGIGLSWWIYSRHPLQSADEPDPLEKLKPDWFATLRGKFFFDQLYEMSVIRWNAWAGRTSRWLDEKVWDNVVYGVSLLTLGVAWLTRLMDEFLVNLGFDQSCEGVRFSARFISWWQNGQVQRYLRTLALGLVILALLFIWGCK